MTHQLLRKFHKPLIFILTAHLAITFLLLSSCNSDDNGIEDDSTLDIRDTDSVSIDSLITETEDSTSLSSDSLLTQFGHSLPVVKITINGEYLWSEDSGLFVVGNGTVENYLQNWEFPAYLSYYEFGEKAFIDTVGFRIKGKKSRHLPNKSIGLYWRTKYGKDVLKHPMFKNNSIEKFERLKLHNGGSHSRRLIIRTAGITRTIQGHTLLDFASTQPVIVYLKEEYWGLYVLTEMITPHYFKYKYDLEKSDINLLVSSPKHPVIDDGTADSWNDEVIPFLTENDLADSINYSEALQMIDKQLLIDYFIIETYIFNRDWPIFNMRWWNSKSQTSIYSKWRYLIFDLDTSFGSANSEELWLGDFFINTDLMDQELGDGFFVFNAFMKNIEFRIEFFSRYLYFIDTVFTEENVGLAFDNLTNEIGVDEYNRHQQKWDYETGETWLEGIESFKKFNKDRNLWIKPLILEWLSEAKTE